MQHVYVSYSPGKYTLAHQVVDDLQAVGYTVFVDAVAEPGTLGWAAETRRAIRASGAVVMILADRHTGLRHEGVLAHRRDRPVIVLRDGVALPRYLHDATVIDCPDTLPYATLLARLLAALPDPVALLAAPSIPAPRPIPPPLTRDSRRERFWRWLRWWGVVMALLLGCVGLGIVVGLIPM
jgi:hypothetical protein